MHTCLLQHFLGGGIPHLPLFQDTQISFLTMSSMTFCFGVFFVTLPETVPPGFDLMAVKEACILLWWLKPLPNLLKLGLNALWLLFRAATVTGVMMDIEVHVHFVIQIY